MLEILLHTNTNICNMKSHEMTHMGNQTLGGSRGWVKGRRGGEGRERGGGGISVLNLIDMHVHILHTGM